MSKRKPDPISRLRVWAVAGGAEHQALTNPYELLRLRVRSGVAIVYRNKSNKQTWNDLATELLAIMERGQAFPEYLQIVSKVRSTAKPSVDHRTISERDGMGCFFCAAEREGEMTIEHLVPRAHGGPNHLSNKFRACRPCNSMAGHLSAPEKIRIREQMRARIGSDQ